MEINIDKIIENIKQELIIVCNKLGYDPSRLNVVDERSFNKTTVSDDIYMVVSLGQVTPNGLVSETPVVIHAMSEINNIDMVQDILITFCNEYNLTSNENYMLEVWSTPTAVSNFEEVGYGIRSIFIMRGSLTIADSSVSDLSLEYNGSPIFLLKANFGYDTITDPEVFHSGNGLTNTLIRSGVRTLTFSTYLTDKNGIVKDMCLAVLHNDDSLRNGIKIRVKQFGEYEDIVFVLTNMTQPKEIGTLASVQLSFTEGGL